MCLPEGSTWPYVWGMMFLLLTFSVLFAGHLYWKWFKRNDLPSFHGFLLASAYLYLYIMTSGKHIKIHFNLTIKVLLNLFDISGDEENGSFCSKVWNISSVEGIIYYMQIFLVTPVNLGNHLKNINYMCIWRLCQ